MNAPLGSSLGRHIGNPPTTEAEMLELRRKAWRMQGCIVVFPQDIDNEYLRLGLVEWAEDQYGKRGQR